MRPFSFSPVAAGVLAALAIGCSNDDGGSGSAAPGDAGGSDGASGDSGARQLVDPGAAPWEGVPAGEVAEACGMDPGLLAETDTVFRELGGRSYAVVRHGRWCHELVADGTADAPSQAYSATKTLGAVVTGIASYETRDLAKTGPKTGPLTDLDRVDHWLDTFTFNQDALVAHVLGMVGHDTDLTPGARIFTYDTIGDVQINRLSDVVNTAIAQDPARLGANIEELTQRFLFQPLGMNDSAWGAGAPNKVYAFTWTTTLGDMARLGLLLLHGGVWQGKRVLAEEWVYRMTHPSFEDANTAYGYLTWLSAATNWINIGGPKLTEAVDDCMPKALWKQYPHEPSGLPDCGYGGASCDEEFDAGVWFAAGLNGQYIFGMPGLDLVLVVKDLHPNVIDPRPTTRPLWAALRKAIVAKDPKYAGDEAAFCADYGANRYAPDLR